MNATVSLNKSHPTKRYLYNALTPNSREVRLLTLQPGHWDSEIRCSLHHDNLQGNSTYEALSYTWGDAKITRPIILNDARLDVTTNLEIALRYADKPRTLWIDAICIDQDNLHERSDQVKLMRWIYTLASTVLAWVGTSDEDSVQAIALTQEINTPIDSVEASADEPFEFSPEYMRKLGFDVSIKNWAALRRFWQRPYWSRIWVVQELASSGDPFETSENRCKIICGHNTIGLVQFTNVARFIWKAQRSNQFFRGGNIEEPVQTMMTTQRPQGFNEMCIALLFCLNKRSENLSVIDFMNVTKTFKATDSRDKLYAILGVTKGTDMAIIPDYTKRPEDVYVQLVLFLIDHQKNLASLHGNRMGTNKFGPSWIPELHGLPNSGPAWANGDNQYAASGTEQPDTSFDASMNLLHVRGTILGLLHTVIGPFSPIERDHPGSNPLNALQLQKLLRLEGPFDALAAFVRTLDKTQHEVFWRTLVMDADFSDFENGVIPAPDEFGIMFKIFQKTEQVPDAFEPTWPEPERILGFCRPWNSNMWDCVSNRCFFTTDCGRMGVGPCRSKPTDLVVLLHGASFCSVLRPCTRGYEFLGDAYVHGVMGGELFEGDQLLPSEMITLC